MGSLTSRPSVPSSVPSYTPPQVVYVPQPASPPPPTPATPSTPAPTPEKARQASLLARDRGRFGTIQTGFRGLLESAFSQGQRKTLLGE